MDIKEIKSSEMSDILDFCSGIDDYGHIFYMDPKKLDEPFKKIMEGIGEVQAMMNESYGM